MTDELPPVDLEEIEQRARGARDAVPTPWRTRLETREATGGASFIQFGEESVRDDELTVDVRYGSDRAVSPDARLDAILDFVAHAIDDVPRLVAEVPSAGMTVDEVTAELGQQNMTVDDDRLTYRLGVCGLGPDYDSLWIALEGGQVKEWRVVQG